MSDRFTQAQVEAHNARVAGKAAKNTALPSSLPLRIHATHIYANTLAQWKAGPNKKRLRQSSKPLMNKLEQAWFDHLKATLPAPALPTLRAQAKRFKLCNGCWYKPDATAIVSSNEIAWEVKGSSKMKGRQSGNMAVKLAAAAFPEITFFFVWREAGTWCTQRVLP
jgi:hypothetical protein